MVVLADLSKQVVIRSRFGAQAGGTPGQYIDSYTSRQNATEALTPYTPQQSVEHYIHAFRQRLYENQDVVEHLGTQEELYLRNEEVTPQSSRLFGNRGLVYTQKDFDDAINSTEHALSQDHTLITPVISFTHDYLKERKIIPEDMPEPDEEKGETYRGFVDQLKLRRAIREGMSGLTDQMGFVDPEWTGSVHLDTQNVHCHVTLIETTPDYDVPDKRIVKRPLEQWIEQEDGTRRRELIRDDDGKVIFESLGERGKIGKLAKEQFRHHMDIELKSLEPYQPFINKDNPHYQMEYYMEGLLELSHSKIQNQIVRLHYALPDDKEKWFYPSNDPEMHEATRHAKQLADILMHDHPIALGLDPMEYELKAYVKRQVPESESNPGFLQDRQRLYKEGVRNLEGRMISSVYETLKKVEVVPEDTENIPNDTSDSIFVEERILRGGMKYSVLPREQLQDLIADSFDRDDEFYSINQNLAMEWRLREFSERLRRSKEEARRYERLKEQYALYEERNMISEDSRIMYELYESEESYHKGVEDKYQYLLANRFGDRRQIDGVVYPLPQSDILSETATDFVQNVDWKDWLSKNQYSLEQAAERMTHFDSDATLEPSEALKYRSLPDTLRRQLSPGIVNVEDEIATSPYKKYQYDTVIELSELGYQYQLEGQGVSKERFEQVKSYDLVETLYDFNRDTDRHIAPEHIEMAQRVNNYRRDVLDDALVYLDRTGQGDGVAYQAYANLRQERLEDMETLAMLKETQTLPIPERKRVEEKEQDHEDLEVVRGLSFSGARKIVKDFMPKVSEVVSDITDRLREEKQLMLERANNLRQVFMEQHRLFMEKDDEKDYNELDAVMGDVPIERGEVGFD